MGSQAVKALYSSTYEKMNHVHLLKESVYYSPFSPTQMNTAVSRHFAVLFRGTWLLWSLLMIRKEKPAFSFKKRYSTDLGSSYLVLCFETISKYNLNL